jgi:hypothetical protein
MVDHAGRIMTDARIALVELVANSYDAGATDVHVSWPDKEGGLFEIRDNGTGMTEDQFKRRWRTLKYNRTMEQGSKVEFPGGPQKRDRTAFGQNGKGRHGAFCFADTYQVETWRDGHVLTAEVSLAANTSRPFNCSITTEGEKSGSGTRIEAAVARNWVPPAAIHDALGTKFLVDTGFTISLNGQKIALQDLESTQAWDVDVPGYGAIRIHQIDSATKGRTTHLKGITWWVNGKMVGEPSWEDLEENGAFLDGRSAAAKTYSFIVEADLLKDEVKADWSGFHATARFNDVRLAATSFITQALRNELYEIRQEKKSIALAKNVETIGGLPRYSRRMVEDFIEEVQAACPKLTEGDLIRTVGIFGKLEQCRSGYDLLVQLNACTPEEIDRWNEIMKKWDARTAEIVLDELERRLRLILQLQKLVHDRTSDELHDLQPLFEKGLWIFGPEYEAIDFCSNRTIVTAIREILGLEVVVDQPRKRMDFLATSDSSLGVYSADEHGEDGEVTGYRKILILELKRGGFSLTQKELDQARDYGLQLRKAGAVPRSTPICAFVLGANVDDGLEKIEQAGITAIPMNYGVVLNKAHARTFKLLQRIREATGVEPDFDKLNPLVGEQPVLGGMFE